MRLRVRRVGSVRERVRVARDAQRAGTGAGVGAGGGAGRDVTWRCGGARTGTGTGVGAGAAWRGA